MLDICFLNRANTKGKILGLVLFLLKWGTTGKDFGVRLCDQWGEKFQVHKCANLLVICAGWQVHLLKCTSLDVITLLEREGAGSYPWRLQVWYAICVRALLFETL
jgi:hypothetical protein